MDYPAIGVQKEVPQTFNPDDHITDGEPVIFTRGSAREGGLMSNAGSCGRRSRNSTALLCAVGEDDRTGQAHNGDAMLLMAPKSLILTKRSARGGGFCEGVKESAIAAGRAHKQHNLRHAVDGDRSGQAHHWDAMLLKKPWPGSLVGRSEVGV